MIFLEWAGFIIGGALVIWGVLIISDALDQKHSGIAVVGAFVMSAGIMVAGSAFAILWTGAA